MLGCVRERVRSCRVHGREEGGNSTQLCAMGVGVEGVAVGGQGGKMGKLKDNAKLSHLRLSWRRLMSGC